MAWASKPAPSPPVRFGCAQEQRTSLAVHRAWRLSAPRRSVEGVNGRLRRAGVRHLDEAKAPRMAGLAVGQNPDGVYRPIRLEELTQSRTWKI